MFTSAAEIGLAVTLASPLFFFARITDFTLDSNQRRVIGETFGPDPARLRPDPIFNVRLQPNLIS
jgi:hypothetical protein